MNFSRALIVLLLPVLFFSCTDTGNDAIPTSEVEQVISPVADAGTIKKNSEAFIPKAKGGFVFAFWAVISDNDTTIVPTRELQASADTTRRVVAHFNEMEIRNDNFTSSHDGRFVYFIHNFVNLPISDDFPPETNLSRRIFQYDVETREKEVIFTSDKQLSALEISANDQFLSFSERRNENVSDLKVLNIEQGTTQKVAPGLRSAWANKSLRLISGNEQGLYIYNAETSTTEFISDRPVSDKPIVPLLTQAAWSPDDRNILLGILEAGNSNEGQFLRYNFAEQRIIEQTVEGLAFGTFYGWIDTTNFVIVGNSPTNRVFRYSITSQEAQQLSFNTFFTVGVSPNSEFVAYSSTRSPLSILQYNFETQSTQSLIESNGIGGNIILNNAQFLVTQFSGGGIALVTLPEGEATQI